MFVFVRATESANWLLYLLHCIISIVGCISINMLGLCYMCFVTITKVTLKMRNRKMRQHIASVEDAGLEM